MRTKEKESLPWLGTQGSCADDVVRETRGHSSLPASERKRSTFLFSCLVVVVVFNSIIISIYIYIEMDR